MALTNDEFITMARYLMVAKMYSLASLVMAIFDICITFDMEVERVWKRKFTFLTGLFLINRYFPILCYTIITMSFHMAWTPEVCHRYILFPGLSRLVWTFAVGSIFILRGYAIFSRDKRVLVVGSLLLATTLVLKCWATLDGTSLPLPGGLVGCILVGKSTGYRFAMTWIAELVFDFIVFTATLLRVITLYRINRGISSSLLALIHKDGVTYFGVIFSANLLSLFIYLFAPPGLKVVNASFSALLTSVMVNRLILNIRGAISTLTPHPPSGLGQASLEPGMSPIHHYGTNKITSDSPGLVTSFRDRVPKRQHVISDLAAQSERKRSGWWDFARS